MAADPVIDTLYLPFRAEALAWPTQGKALFLRARDSESLRPFRDRLLCEQTFKPAADALTHAGFKVDNQDKVGGFPLVLVLPPRQREEARALMARAVSLVDANGVVLACAANDEGARSLEADLAQLAGPLSTLSKRKCRVFWTRQSLAARNAPLLDEWRSLDVPRPILNGRFVSRPGVFAWDRIDVASAMLAEHLPTDLAGRVADLGAGFGYLAAELLSRAPNVRAVDLYEAELRALELARVNLQAFAERAELEFHWRDVTSGLCNQYDAIVTNPPFHAQSGRDRPDVGRRFIAVAAESLRPGGRLWLVANRHLPYEQALGASFASVRVVAQAHGFKVIEAIKSTSAKR